MAWVDVAAPSGEDVVKALKWSLCDSALDTLLGIAPMDVDIHSSGFYAATPLFDLPPTAAAAYLGTFLLSLVDSLEFWEKTGLPMDDLQTGPHTLTFLTRRHFWDEVIRKNLPKHRQEVVADVALFLVARRDALALTEEDVEKLLVLAQGGTWDSSAWGPE
jgi:hypothetical protein